MKPLPKSAQKMCLVVALPCSQEDPMPCAHSEWKGTVVRRQKIDECPMQEKTKTSKRRKQFPLLPCLRSAPSPNMPPIPKTKHRI